jgi:lipopolysaccharide/colanic/teichoic acid biosynthesis glycosyltransferase
MTTVLLETTDLEHSSDIHRAGLLPETFSRAWRLVLIYADGLVALFASVLVSGHVGVAARFALALLCATIVLASFAVAGCYARSFAVSSRDEVYQAIPVLVFAAVPYAIVLLTLGHVRPIGMAFSIIVLIAGTAWQRALLHSCRRTTPRAPYMGIGRLTPCGSARAERAATVKRLFDIVVAAIGLVVCSPVMLVIALAIRNESGRPILFVQQRVGRNGATFSILKFRTMRLDSSGEWVRPGDSRVTPLGRFLRRSSLDELPQLLNVLRGDMSIVGPRPEMKSFADEFARAIPNYSQRHIVTPGLTGWAQLYLARNLEPADAPEVVRYDLFYIEHASLLLDATIVLKTAAEFLFHRAM